MNSFAISSSILRVHNPRLREAFWIVLKAISCALFGYAAWTFDSAILLLLALPPLWIYTKSKWETLAGAMGYYLCIDQDTSWIIHNFYETSHAISFLIVLAHCLLLSMPWFFARWWIGNCAVSATNHRFQIALLVAWIASIIPPIGWIGWGNPAFAAGALWPGHELLSIVVTMVFVAVATVNVLRGYKQLAVVIVIFLFLQVSGAAVMKQVVVGMADTSILPMTLHHGKLDYNDTINRMKWISDSAAFLNSDKAQNVSAVVFPENYMGEHRPSIDSMQMLYGTSLAKNGKSILFGMNERVMNEGTYPTLYSIGAERGIIYRARLPVVLSLALTDSNKEIADPWRSPIEKFNGKNTFFAICYESYLLEHLISGTITKNKAEQMIVSSNLWAVGEEGIAKTIQQRSMEMSSRILGIPLFWSVNY